MRAIRGGEFSEDNYDATKAKQTLYNAKTCTFLVLDEYSAELAGSEYDKRTLTNLIDHRYGRAGRATVIITNTPIEQAPAEVGRSAWEPV